MAILVFFCLAAQFAIATSVRQQQSLLNPSWKHCVHRLNAKRTWQEFVSPGYPHGITTQTQCSWIVSANTNQRIKLAFFNLNLTGSINNCFTQFVEIWDLKTSSSMGRFCGDRKPGDYVTHGYMARVDVKADTAAAGHEGFMIKYRITREPGGFKQSFAFPDKPKPNPKTKKKSKTKTKGKGKTVEEKNPTKPPSINSHGGRVNLGLRKKLREKGSRKQGTSVKKPSPIPSLKPAPIRTLQRKPTLHNQHRPYEEPRTPGTINISIDDDSDKLPFELWIIILIGVGSLLFIAFLSVLTWLCFCRKRKERSASNQPQVPKTPLNAIAHPIQRRHELPKGSPSTTNPAQTLPTTNFQMQNFYVPQTADALPLTHLAVAPPASRHALPQRAPKKDALTRKLTNQNQALEGLSLSTVLNTKEMEFHNGIVTPFEGGYLFHPPVVNPGIVQPFPATAEPKPMAIMSSSSEDEGIVTEFPRTISNRTRSKKQVPTLKRKFCQWEKEEIKKGNVQF